MRKNRLILSIVVIIAMSIGMTSCQAEEGDKEITLDEFINGLFVATEFEVNEVKVGDLFLIVLEGNPSTGYTWEFTFEPEGSLELMEDRGFRDSDLMGAPEKHAWKFKALTDGEIGLTFNYLRPWEGEEGIIETKEFIIMVSE